jgi:hypothetical protein
MEYYYFVAYPQWPLTFIPFVKPANAYFGKTQAVVSPMLFFVVG